MASTIQKPEAMRDTFGCIALARSAAEARCPAVWNCTTHPCQKEQVCTSTLDLPSTENPGLAADHRCRHQAPWGAWASASRHQQLLPGIPVPLRQVRLGVRLQIAAIARWKICHKGPRRWVRLLLFTRS